MALARLADNPSHYNQGQRDGHKLATPVGDAMTLVGSLVLSLVDLYNNSARITVLPVDNGYWIVDRRTMTVLTAHKTRKDPVRTPRIKPTLRVVR